MQKEGIRELISRASKDIELAKRHRKTKEYMTATILYNNAVEKVLKALFISKKKRSPPANASISYLARQTGVPDEISMYIYSMQESAYAEDPVPEDFTGLNQYEEERAGGESLEVKAFFLDGLSKRLLDYVLAYAKN
ncbi:MAG: HEPN domain-containing protein [Candidatus Micrarchaeaceae archaeon]